MKLIKKYKRLHTIAAVVAGIVVIVCAAACKKTIIDPVEVYPDPPGKLVKFLDGAPSPSSGREGAVVTFNVNGLKGKEDKFDFFVNQTKAEVIAVEENTVKVLIPENASTGGVSILIDNEYYFGPTFTVTGNVVRDDDFNTDINRTDDNISGILDIGSDKFLLYGSFKNYGGNSSPLNAVTSLAVINKTGQYQPDFSLGKKGINGPVNSVLQTNDGYVIGGSFSTYDTVSNINNITLLNFDGSLKTKIVDVVNPDPVNHPGDNQALVPYFNGGVSNGVVTNVLNNHIYNGITVFGNFETYVSTFYERSTIKGPYLDLAAIRQKVSMHMDGSLDSSFNYNFSLNKSYAGGNGFITSAIQLSWSDDNYIVSGWFTSFDGQSAYYLAKINGETGLLDQEFNKSGSGADGVINKIEYNGPNGTLLLTGSFKHYNGVAADGVVMINEDGSIHNDFVFRKLEGGFANFAGQLSDGKIIVSGTFSKYDGIVRPGFMILNEDGSLAAGYNNTGLFRGAITGFAELDTKLGIKPVILVGLFDRFDGHEAGNIVKFNITE